jgi:hypothetical protein
MEVYSMGGRDRERRASLPCRYWFLLLAVQPWHMAELALGHLLIQKHWGNALRTYILELTCNLGLFDSQLHPQIMGVLTSTSHSA